MEQLIKENQELKNEITNLHLRTFKTPTSRR